MNSGAQLQPKDGTGVDFVARLAMLGDSASSRVRKIGGAYLAGEATWRLVKIVRQRVRSQLTFKVSVPSDDDIYPDVHRWLMDQVPSRKIKSVHAQMDRSWGNKSEPQPVGVAPRRRAALRVHYNGEAEQSVRIGGHRVIVNVEKIGAGALSGSGGGTADDLFSLLSRASREERINFTTYGADARDAVLGFLEGLVARRDRETSQPAFFLADRWGNWERRDDLPRRDLGTIVLRAGQKERLVEDVEAFLAAERDYARLGVPWHRGYLLHGPAGTGKTSIAQALATHFDLDLYYLPLSDLSKDASLLRLVGQVQARSLLLLEDIDIVHAARARDDEADGVTMSGLLNCLDGVATPAGLITVMTTNHIEVLDEAIIRAGRIDRTEEVGFLDRDQLDRLVDTFLPGHVGIMPALNGHRISPAAVIEIVKRHVGGSPAAAFNDLADLVRAGPSDG